MMYLNGLVHSGLPQSQEKIEVFENKSGNLTKLKKKKFRYCQFKFTKFFIF